MMNAHRFDFTTNASGAVAITATPEPLNGRFVGFELILGTATAVDILITNSAGNTLYTKTGHAANGLFVVSRVSVDNAGTAIAASAIQQPVVGPLSLTIANGGDTKTASIIIYVESHR